MRVVNLLPTRCAICGTTENATELYPRSFRLDDLSPATFSARRSPDRVHYRMVRCETCGLVRSDPIANPQILTRLYQEAAFDYDQEVGNLRATYGRYLAKLALYCGQRSSLLDVGCGNGFALEEALDRGFATIQGIEPSTMAVASAAPHIRPFIINENMRAGLLEPAQFDAVCLFQMFDHVPDPAGLLEECRTVLKRRGLILILNHNVEALSARLLRRSSPIVDIEHTYLYSPATLSRICLDHGFEIREMGAAWNRTRIGYLARLAPLPLVLRRAMLKACDSTALGRVSLPLPLGNLYLIAQRAG